MNQNSDSYGVIRDATELGQLVRSHRKQKSLTLDKTSGLANLSVRFLSEFERGKDTAEIGKVFKALRTLGLELTVQPRGGNAAVSDTAATHSLPDKPSDSAISPGSQESQSDTAASSGSQDTQTDD